MTLNLAKNIEHYTLFVFNFFLFILKDQFYFTVGKFLLILLKLDHSLYSI